MEQTRNQSFCARSNGKIGSFIEKLDKFTISLLSNDEVLEVDQDPLGRQAYLAYKDEEREVWVKSMEDGSKAVGLFNLTEEPLNIPVDLKDLNLKGRWNLRDLWRQTNLGAVEQHFEMNVLPHGAMLIKIAK